MQKDLKHVGRNITGDKKNCNRAIWKSVLRKNNDDDGDEDDDDDYYYYYYY